MEALVHWFSQNLSQYISPEGAVFIISMIPLLELRGGLLAASLLKISAAKAIPLCIVGNIIPIPFILLFIRQIFKVLKKTKLFRGLVMKLEDRAMRKSDQVKKYEFWGGRAGYVDGTPDDALFDEPWGVAVDEEGTIYIADTKNKCIRKLAIQ